MPPDPKARATPAVPDHQLIRVIGRGSYGEVWLAFNAIGAARAVKIVYRDQFSNERPYEREFTGIKKYEPISRSNEALVDVLQVGRNDQAGYFYYVMELADDAAAFVADDLQSRSGLSETAEEIPKPEDERTRKREQELVSSSRLPVLPFSSSDTYLPRTLALEVRRQSRLPYEECLQLGLSLSLALGHLHRHGLIHRDIKPSNIIFVNGVPKLADMGLITDIEGANSFVGTEGFIPPEGPNSTQADIFSLGKVLYEISMGKDRKDFPEPFTYVEQAPDAEALMELNAVILRACAPQPRDRYRSAEELHVDLALLQGGQSVRKRRLLEKRLQFAVRAGIAVGGFALLALTAYLREQRQARQALEQAERETGLRQIADDQARRAEASEQQSRERLVRLHVATGVRHLESRDFLGALPWFLEALKTDQGNPEREEMHRTRIAAVLRQLPKLVQVWFPNASVMESQFSPHGRLVLFMDEEDRVLRLCDANTGQPFAPALRHPAPVRYAFFSPNGRYVMAVVTDNTAWVWKLASGEPAASPLRHEGKVNFAVFSPDSERVATVSEDATARVWNLATGQSAAILPHPKAVNYAAFSPDGRWLATAGNDGEARLWEGQTGQPRTNALKHPGAEPVRLTQFSRDGRRLLTVAGNSAYVWNLSAQPAPPPQAFSTGLWIYGALFSPDAQRVLTWGRDSAARVWDAQSGAPALPPLKHEHGVLKAEFSPDGQRILTVSGDYSLRVWDALTGELAAPPLTHQSGAISYAQQFSAEGRRIITSQPGIVRVWDLATSEAPASIDASTLIKRVFFSQDGRHLLTITMENVLQCWDPWTGREQFDYGPDLEPQLPVPFDANLAPINPALLPDGSARQVILRSPLDSLELVLERNAAFVRDAKTSRPLTSRFRHRENITSAAFSRDGRRVATTSVDGTARVWDAQTGEPLTPAFEHISPVYQAAFSPDGRLLATLTQTSPSVWVWNLSPDPRPLNDLAALSQLLTGADLDANGALQPRHQPAASSNHWHRLRNIDPADFATTPEHRARWHFRQALGLLRMAPLDQALAHLEAGASPRRWTEKAKFCASIRQWSLAFTNFSKALEGESENPDLWDRRGATTLRMNQLTNALADFSKAVELDPKRAPSWHHRGLILQALNRIEEAAAAASKAAELQPASAAYWERRGRISALMTNWDRALADFTRAHEIVAGVNQKGGGDRRPLRELITPRDPRANLNQLDLSLYFNASLTPLSPDSPWPSPNLPSLPKGLAKLGGVEFDVRGVIQLTSVEMVQRGGSFPARVLGIPLRRACRALHFLHSAMFMDRPGHLVAKYVIHYADGQRQEQLIFFNEQVSDVFQPCRIALKSTVIASSLNREDDAQTVFVTTWQNPRPDTQMVMIDFVSINSYAAPFLIALTAE